jgi:hypothetical protein
MEEACHENAQLRQVCDFAVRRIAPDFSLETPHGIVSPKRELLRLYSVSGGSEKVNSSQLY